MNEVTLALIVLALAVWIVVALIQSIFKETRNGIAFVKGRFARIKPHAGNAKHGGTLIERNHDIICTRLEQIRTDSKAYYIENEVRDCVSEIATREGRPNLVPAYRQWLSAWASRPDLPNDFRELKDYVLATFKTRHEYLTTKKKEEDDKKTEQLGLGLLDRNKDLVEKFFEIAERKVSIVDEYGDENLEALPTEMDLCLRKIGDREGLHFNWGDYTKVRRKGGWAWPSPPSEYLWLQKRLGERFLEFHLERSKARPFEDVSRFSGMEFEVHVANLLRSQGYEVCGTPQTGDQGADLIAKKSGKMVIIQAKRYQGVVGNSAVQEVIAALQYYGGDEGWVVTNSTFSSSAKALAQKANVRLIDNAALQRGLI
jgi:hypothetical protein